LSTIMQTTPIPFIPPTPMPTNTPTLTLTPTLTQQEIIDSLKLSNTGNAYELIFFTDDYRELPHRDEIIDPDMIVLHWDEQPGSPEYWSRNKTYNGLSSVKERYDLLEDGRINTQIRASNVHFGLDKEGISQYLPMYEDYVQHSYGAFAYPTAINIEMAGVDFRYGEGWTNVPNQEVENALNLVLELMLQYDIPFEQLYGHYEKDTYVAVNGVEYDRGKPDPGPEFMQYFRDELKTRIDEIGLNLGQ